MDMLFSPSIAGIFFTLTVAIILGTLLNIVWAKSNLLETFLGIYFLLFFVYYIAIFIAIGIMVLNSGWDDGVFIMDADAVTPVRVDDWDILFSRADKIIVFAFPENASIWEKLFTPETINTSSVEVSTYSSFLKNHYKELVNTSSPLDFLLPLITLVISIVFSLIEILVSTILYGIVLPFEVAWIGLHNLALDNGVLGTFLSVLHLILVVGNLFLISGFSMILITSLSSSSSSSSSHRSKIRAKNRAKMHARNRAKKRAHFKKTR